VYEQSAKEEAPKPIQVFIGSDVLRAHNADILLSSNTLSIYDDDRSKLSIPLVRPEDERTFKPLRVSSISVPIHESVSLRGGNDAVNARAEAERHSPQAVIAPPPGFPSTPSHTAQQVDAPESSIATATNASASVIGSDDDSGSTRRSIDARPILAHLNTKAEARDSSDGNAASSSALRSGTSPNPHIWGNWRRESEQKSSAPLDWANAGKSSSSSYQRRDQGIKVLRPSKTPSRTFSGGGGAQASSPSFTGQSRFFDDGKRRQSATAAASESGDAQLRRSVSGSSSTAAANSASKEPQSALSKPRSANPIGGASAFSWLKTGHTE
jgi:ubiquitin carboxyl-terminal hydrolase 4/11/15